MDTERDAALLLVAMHQDNEADPAGFVAVDRLPGWAEKGLRRLRVLTGHLREAGLAESLGITGGMVWRTTPTGVARAERLLRDRDRPIVRYDAAVNGLVTAAVDEFPHHRLELREFALSPHARVLDTVLSPAEIATAVDFLEKEGLVTVERADATPTAIALTSRGRECGWTDTTDVRAYVMGRRPGGLHQNWNVTVHGGAPQIGHDNVQHRHPHGPDPGPVLRFAGTLREKVAGGSVTVPEDARHRVARDVDALEREAGRAEPRPDRVRELLVGLREALATPDTRTALDEIARLLPAPVPPPRTHTTTPARTT
ncbi:hypothetical protein ACFUJ0_19685 [Streptomyces sp. NPDC057242]|uniref:hypothetical protein n=1 Tax=unclassified Streptomyces TaxID=2593676 RepID=UPI003637B34C